MMKTVVLKSALLLTVFAASAASQLVWWGDYIPRREKPPVVFVTGHDALCPDAKSGELPFFQLTFGEFDKVMARDGRVSLVFEACYAANRPPIEEIANTLKRLIEPLRYEDGEPVREVDVVAHSMGGLIVRAYLAGKQTNGTFLPPAGPRVRKVVFIGTPHFGTSVATSTHADPQIREMAPGSAFLFDLATWNQGTDDLRGVDALSIVGTGGRNGPATDSVVTVTSGSLDFVSTGRTAVLPYCHTQGGIGQLFLCEAAPGLARVNNQDHPTARLVLAFLSGMDTWRSATVAASANPVLAQTTGIMLQSRTADDAPRGITFASVKHTNGSVTRLDISGGGLAFAEMLPAGRGVLSVDGIDRPISLSAGGARALVVKPGPFVEAVEPAAGRSGPLVLSPGMLVAIRGVELNLGRTEVTFAGRPVSVVSAAHDRIDAVLPDSGLGLSELTVRTASGRHTVRVMLEQSVPVVFLREGIAAAIHGTSGQPVSLADPATSGEIVSLFLTGLGNAAPNFSIQPTVRIAERECEVLYAGRAPGLPGVDQINFRMPAVLRPGTNRLQVQMGSRIGGADIPIR